MEPESLARQAFILAALAQGRCAVSGTRSVPWHPHHVIYAKHLLRFGLPLYDRRNALRIGENVHANHHGTRPIPTVKLLKVNIDYASAALGAARAAQYLRRYYDDETEPDPRLERLCPAGT